MKKNILKKIFIKISKLLGFELIDQNEFNSPTLNKELNEEMVLFCAGGLRSALAAKSLQEMGFKNVAHIDGGFASMIQSGFKIE